MASCPWVGSWSTNTSETVLWSRSSPTEADLALAWTALRPCRCIMSGEHGHLEARMAAPALNR